MVRVAPLVGPSGSSSSHGLAIPSLQRRAARSWFVFRGNRGARRAESFIAGGHPRRVYRMWCLLTGTRADSTRDAVANASLVARRGSHPRRVLSKACSSGISWAPRPYPRAFSVLPRTACWRRLRAHHVVAQLVEILRTRLRLPMHICQLI